MSAGMDKAELLSVLNRAEPIIANSDHGDAYAVLTQLPDARLAIEEVFAQRDELEKALRLFMYGCSSSAAFEAGGAALARVEGAMA